MRLKTLTFPSPPSYEKKFKMVEDGKIRKIRGSYMEDPQSRKRQSFFFPSMSSLSLIMRFFFAEPTYEVEIRNSLRDFNA